MEKILNCMAVEIATAFQACGYDKSYAKITLSNRTDMCEFQCNGAMDTAKAYKKKPIDITTQETDQLKD